MYTYIAKGEETLNSLQRHYLNTNCTTGTTQVTEGRKYIHRVPRVGQRCCTVAAQDKKLR
jgi:hypothetical protein